MQAAPALGHDLWAAQVKRGGRRESSLVMCFKCGTFAETGENPALHKSQCSGPTSKHGWAQISRAKRGLYPRAGRDTQGATLTDLVRL